MYYTIELLKRAIKDNDKHVIFYILNWHDLLSYHAFDYSAKIGNVALMEEIFKNFGLVMINEGFYKDVLNTAIEHGQDEVIKYLSKFI